MTLSTLSAVIAELLGVAATGTGIAADVTRKSKFAVMSVAAVVLLLVTVLIRFATLG